MSLLSANHEPNPRRVAAGRANRRKRGPLTEEGLRKLKAAAAKNKPWLHSTGPRTPEGKKQAALNGKRRQSGLLSIREMRRDLQEVRKLIRAMQSSCELFGQS